MRGKALSVVFRSTALRLASFLPLMVAMAGCAPAIAPYSPAAYELAVDAKVDALRLMDAAEFAASDEKRRIDTMLRDLDRAYEFALGRPRNEYSTKQWALMRDPEGNLLGGFIARWQHQEQLSAPFIAAARPLIEQAFDAIIGLESGKLRAVHE